MNKVRYYKKCPFCKANIIVGITTTEECNILKPDYQGDPKK